MEMTREYTVYITHVAMLNQRVVAYRDTSLQMVCGFLSSRRRFIEYYDVEIVEVYGDKIITQERIAASEFLDKFLDT